MLASPTNPDRPVLAPEKDQVDRSIAIGLACTLAFHLLLVWLSPNFAFEKFSGVHSGINVNHNSRGKTFDFELAPPQEPEKPKPQLKFMETNSAAPENTPDKTDFFSSRNQQSAQEVAAKEHDLENRPSVKGQDKIKNDSAIVSGDLSKPQLAAPPVPDLTKTDDRDQKEQLARAEQVPLSGTEKMDGKSPDGIAMNISQSKSPTTNAAQAVEGAHEATDPNGGLVALPQLTHAPPKERPRVSSVSLNRSTILTNRATGTTNIGIQASDAFKSEYGEYLQQLIEAVQLAWNHILQESRVMPNSGSHVVVTFTINSQGMTNVTKIEDFDAGKQGASFCVSAITDPAPYRKWSEPMIALLGEEQTITFNFLY